jgi:hypothetical protein
MPEKYKPAAETYLWQLKTSCKTARNDLAHGWDLAGAANAGLATDL